MAFSPSERVQKEDEIPGSLLKEGSFILIGKWLTKEDLKSPKNGRNLGLFVCTNPVSLEEQLGVIRATENEMIQSSDSKMITRVCRKFEKPAEKSFLVYFQLKTDSKGLRLD
jgi:hypothetical protein